MANKIVTILDLDDRGFNGSIGRIKAQLAAVDGSFGKLKVGAKGIFDEFKRSNSAQAAVGAGFVVGAKLAVDAASDLEESVNAVRVTFGDAADDVLKIGESSATSFGLAKSEFNGLAVQFSSFAKTISAGGGGTVGEVITDLTTRVADFASVMNLDLTTATQVFMSTMAGETETIRRFGKDVSAAAVELYALENGLADSKSEMTEAVKVQARYGLLMEQTSDTAGDFANTSDSLANSQRILTAEAKDLAAEFGEDLTPAITTVIKGLRGIMDAAEAIKLDEVLDLSWVESFGTTLGKVLSPWNTGARQANEALAKPFKEGEAAAASFDRTLLDGLDTFEQVRAKVLDLTDSEHAANVIALEWKASTDELVTSTDELVESTDELSESTLDLGDKAANAKFKIGDLGAAAKSVAERDLQAAEDAIRDLQDAYDDLSGDISKERAFLQMSEDLYAAGGNADITRLEVLDLKDQVIDYAEQLGNIPPDVTTDILALIDQGKYGEALALLGELEKPRFATLTIKTSGGLSKNSYYADGTNFHPGGLAVVGERGPELVDLPRGSKVSTATETRAMLSSPAPLGASGVGGPAIHIDTFIDQSGTSLDNVFRTASAFLQMMGPS